MQDKPTGTAEYRPILFSITIAVFMCLLDSHIVRICLPVIARDFGISSGQSSWVNLAYLLVAAPALPVFGKIADIIGYKNIFIFGYGLFTIGSMLCGISPNAHALVISRLIQGIGGGMLTELLSWCYIFYINVPVSLAGIYFAVRSIPQDLCAAVFKTLQKTGYTRKHLSLPLVALPYPGAEPALKVQGQAGSNAAAYDCRSCFYAVFCEAYAPLS